MSEISSLYNSNHHIYKSGTKPENDKGMHGDVKHIVFKDGVAVKTEVIPVAKRNEETEKTTRVRSEKVGGQRRSSASAQSYTDKDIDKFRKRLLQAKERSETLWSEKAGVLISYQGSQGFLVKRFNGNNRLLSQELMTLEGLLDCKSPEIIKATWKMV